MKHRRSIGVVALVAGIAVLDGGQALHAAEIHEERSRIMVQRLVALMVPAITILMGVAVAGIVASLLTEIGRAHV